MNFSQALDLMKTGRRCYRAGWNGVEAGRTMWIGLCSAYVDGLGPTQPFLYIRDPSARIIPWLASQADLLADDWHEFEGLTHRSACGGE